MTSYISSKWGEIEKIRVCMSRDRCSCPSLVQNVEGSSASKALTESLKLITFDEGRLADVDNARWMIRRIVESWKDLGADLRVEEDVLVGVAVELGIYPSKGQRPAWVERGLTSR